MDVNGMICKKLDEAQVKFAQKSCGNKVKSEKQVKTNSCSAVDSSSFLKFPFVKQVTKFHSSWGKTYYKTFSLKKSKCCIIRGVSTKIRDVN